MPTEKDNRFYKKSMNQWIFNQMIFDTRVEYGLSQDEMGRLLKVSGKTIYGYEVKKIKPSMDVIIEFLKVFNKKVFIVDRFEDVTEFSLSENTYTKLKD